MRTRADQRIRRSLALAGGLASLAASICIAADTPGPATQPAAAPSAEQSGTAPERFSIHAQATVISQAHNAFHSPYEGPNSLPRHEGWKTSVTGTVFLGARLWEGGAIYFNPEIAGGEGLGGVHGIAGFPNGEIERVGNPAPQPYVARLYFQQVFGLGGEREKVEGQQNQLAGYRDVSRLTVTLGKMSAVDFFDNNAYSHDPRSQFENESLMDNGAWDYPADTRGYAIGGVVELNQPNWALRYGAFTEPKTANGATFDAHVPQALGQAIELEERWTIHDHPGAVRLLGFANLAHMGNYREAIDHPGPAGPEVALTRTYSAKYGFGLSAEQELLPGLGAFGRLGWNDGHTETWAFTEIDRTASLGLSLRGDRWHRPDDVVAIAAVVNGISKDHRDYLAAGGLGFLLGDGRLHYGYEEIGEAYYLMKLSDHLFVSADLQFIENPGYNRDRGPVTVGGVRVHVEF